MGATTKIEWSDATWGPTRGCSMAKGSENGGCLNCYAARYAVRGLQRDSKGSPFAIMRDSGPRWTGVVELAEDMLLRPLSWKKPRKIFVNSMSDLFHEALPDEAIDRVFAVMALCPHHTFQILTKRPERMLKWFRGDDGHAEAMTRLAHEMVPDCSACWTCDEWPLPNVQLGVSVENTATQRERVPLLQQTPAAVRFVSQEPQLEFIDWPPEMLAGISQVIVGGESGPGARPFQAEWMRSTIAQCREANVACFAKQFGANAWQGGDNGTLRTKMPFRDKKGGDISEFPRWAQVREFPGVSA